MMFYMLRNDLHLLSRVFIKLCTKTTSVQILYAYYIFHTKHAFVYNSLRRGLGWRTNVSETVCEKRNIFIYKSVRMFRTIRNNT